jgi:outer membrane lipoprotein SlyB
MSKLAILLIVMFFAGCATGPVLYPNAHLKKVGEDQAHRDIAACEQQANVYVKSDAGIAAAKSTVVGTVGGAVVGGAIGAITGDFGRGIAIGAAGGAAAGLVQGIVQASKPSPVFINFVDRCLREKGYEPIGWK